VVVGCVVRRCHPFEREIARGVCCAVESVLEIQKCKEIVVIVVVVGPGYRCRVHRRCSCGVVGVAGCVVRRCCPFEGETARGVHCSIGCCLKVQKCKEVIIIVIEVVSGCRCWVRRRCSCGVGGIAGCVVRRLRPFERETARGVRCSIGCFLKIQKCKEVIVIVVKVVSGCCCRRAAGVIGAAVGIMVAEVAAVEKFYVVWCVAFSTMGCKRKNKGSNGVLAFFFLS